MAEKEAMMWDYRDEEAVPAAAAQEKPSRGIGEWISDVAGNAVDALANGGRGAAVLGAALQAGIGTDRYMAEKQMLANRAALSDLGLRKAQRAEDRELANLPIEEATRQKELNDLHDYEANRSARNELAKKRLALAGEQTDAALIRARQQRIGEERRLSADITRQTYEHNPGFVELPPDAQQKFLNSRAVRAEKELRLVGRALFNARNGKPGALDDAKEILQQMGAQLVEHDGKHYVIYKKQPLELNEPNLQKILAAVQKRSDDELNNYIAYNPTNIAGDVMMSRTAHYADMYRNILGGDYTQSVERSKQMLKNLSQNERDVYGMRYALENLLMHPDDPAALQGAMVFMSTPNGTTKSILQRNGYEITGVENTDNWLATAVVFKRKPDGTKGESMNLQKFLQRLREEDTATAKMDKMVADDMERVKRAFVLADAAQERKALGGTRRQSGAQGGEAEAQPQDERSVDKKRDDEAMSASGGQFIKEQNLGGDAEQIWRASEGNKYIKSRNDVAMVFANARDAAEEEYTRTGDWGKTKEAWTKRFTDVDIPKELVPDIYTDREQEQKTQKLKKRYAELAKQDAQRRKNDPNYDAKRTIMASPGSGAFGGRHTTSPMDLNRRDRERVAAEILKLDEQTRRRKKEKEARQKRLAESRRRQKEFRGDGR